MMTKKKHSHWSRVVSLLLVLLLLIGGFNFMYPLRVHATTPTGEQGNIGNGNDVSGSGSGTPTPGRTNSMVCLCFTFWERNASNQWELKYGILQIANPTSSWFNASKYAKEQLFEQTAGGSAYMKSYLQYICSPDVVIPDGVQWDIYGQNHFAATYNSETAFKKVSMHEKLWGSIYPAADMSSGRAGATREQLFAKTESYFNPEVNPAASQVIGNLEMAYQMNTNSLAQIGNGSLEIGVSEVIISVSCSGQNATINGAAYNPALNSMGVQEGQPILFKVGQQACFTYLGGGGSSGAVCTYDVRNHPSYPSHAENPWQNPQIEPKKGPYTIRKVYVDLTGGANKDFTTSQVCRSVWVDDEVGKIDDDWDFQFWCLSAIGANGFSKNNYSGFYSSAVFSQTGMVDMVETAANLGHTNYKQINLLFVKSSNGQPGSTIMTEQTLGIGTTQTWDYVALDGRDEVGYWEEATGNCTHEWDGAPWVEDGYLFGWEDNDGDGIDDDGWTEWRDRSHWTHYTCNASQTHLLGRTTTRTVSLGTGTFQTVTFGGNVIGVDSGASVSRSGNTWTITRSTSDSEPYHYHDSNGEHVNHNPSGSSLSLFQDAKIQITGFALYRNTGLGDYIEPAFNNSAFVENFYDDATWGFGKARISRVGSSEFSAQVPSSTYAYGVANTTNRHGAGGNWTALPSMESYGSRGFIYTLSKGASSTHTWSGGTKTMNHPDTINTATFRTSGSGLLDNIQVWSYFAHPNITPATFGDRVVYDLPNVRPFVIMRLPYAMSASNAPVQWDTQASRDRAAYVMVKGEYDRRLILGSQSTARAYPLDGIEVRANTLLNDARVVKYIVNDLKWVGDEVPYAIPGGSVIYIGQQTTGNQSKSKGAIGAVDIDTTQAFLGQYAPLRLQLEGKTDQFFDVQGHELETGAASLQRIRKDGQEWANRYFGQPCADDSYYKGGKCLDEYYDECEKTLEKIYLSLYVYDTIDPDSFKLEDGKLLKRKNIDTPTGIIASGSTKITLDGAPRDLHLDEKYSFGGLDNHLYVRVIRDYFPTTQFSYIGIDTCGGAYVISGPPYSWDVRQMDDATFAAYIDYFQPVYALLGSPATFSDFKNALRNLDIETNEEAANKLYMIASQISLSGFANAPMKNSLAEAYALQERVDHRLSRPDRNYTYALYLKDGMMSNNSQFQGGDPTIRERAQQLADSVEHDVGNDYTWYEDGDWYNEAVLPYYEVYTRQTFKLVIPANSSTIIDPSLMGISDGKDDMFGASDVRWNGAVVGLAFDGMTSSDFDHNMKFTLPSWGSNPTYVELAPIGVSHPMAISNTSVNDLY